jgi:acetyl esterase/lipase
MNIEEYIASMDPELRTGFIHTMPFFSSRPSDLIAARKWMADLIADLTAGQPTNDRVQIENRSIPGPIGAPDVPVRIYTPTTRAGSVPGLLYIHGGGFTLGNLDTEDVVCQYIVEEVGCVVVSVDYRLAPEHPFPAAPEDCYAALTWMAANAKQLGVDPARIGIRGGSAGGGLCAAVALMARDRKEVKLLFQMPLYGCLDDRHTTPSSHQIAASDMIWSRPASLLGWQAYLGEDHQGDISPYAAPARAQDLSGLPPAYIMVGELDLMRDENIEYAMRLMQADVPTELHVYPGAFHGFEGMVPTASVSIRAVNEYTQALKRGLIPTYVQKGNSHP